MVPDEDVFPLNEAILLLPLVALVATVNVPEKLPAAVGEKTTLTVHVSRLASEAPAHESELITKGVEAVTATVPMIRLPDPPVFVTVKVCELVLPTSVSG